MAQTIKLKRSAVASTVPTTAQLVAGEIGLNTADGKMFIRRDTPAIVEMLSDLSVIGDFSNVIITTPATDEVLTYNGTNWVNQAPDGGKILQTVSAAVVAASGTSTIPFDSTLPQSGEGTEVGAVTITPASTANKVSINCSVPVGVSSQVQHVVLSLFRGTTCIASTVTFSTKNGHELGNLCFDYEDSPNTTAATTYSIRVGTTGGTWYVCLGTGGETLGGSLESQINVMEVAA